jgi:predicted CoA-binding protein
MSERVVILGASDQPDRYAHRAFRMLREHGHQAIPVHPTLDEIEGVPVVPDLRSVEGMVDTLTLYVRPAISESVADDIVAMKPGRVLFNPGTESPTLQAKLDEAAIPWEEACTLVLLGTGMF